MFLFPLLARPLKEVVVNINRDTANVKEIPEKERKTFADNTLLLVNSTRMQIRDSEATLRRNNFYSLCILIVQITRKKSMWNCFIYKSFITKTKKL